MKNATKKTLLIFLTVVILMITTSAIALADPQQAVVTFEKPEGTSLEVHRGFPSATNLVEPEADGTYLLEKGYYYYSSTGKGFYNIKKVFVVWEADVTAGSKTIEVLNGKMATNGWQCTGTNTLYSDEYINAFFSTDGLVGYPEGGFDTPAFKDTKALMQYTTHGEMITYINNVKKTSENMYVYYIGYSPAYGLSYPVVLFTKEDIPAKASLAEAAEIINQSDKLMVQHQAQIHGNETVATEAALALIKDMAGSYGDALLDDINMIVVPRINVDGTYNYIRTNVKGKVDMNRDHLRVASKEIAMLHSVYNTFMPELVLDGHEFGGFSVADRETGLMTSTEDLEVTAASSMNINEAVRRLATDVVVEGAFYKIEEKGVRVCHYGTTKNNAIGRAYYGLFNSVSVLIESRWSDKDFYGRRVFAHLTAAKSLIETAIENSEEIIKAVADARADVIAKGAIYDEEDTVILEQSNSGQTWGKEWARPSFYLNGTVADANASRTLYHYDTVVRERTRPTAYIIAKDETWAAEALRILTANGAEYFELEEGATVAGLQHYIQTSTYTNGNINTAELTEPENITFVNGAYVFPMDQVAGNIIALTLEPDVNDTNNYNGTLVQSKIVVPDENGVIPIYRFTQDNPRTSIYGTTSGVTFVAPEGLSMDDLEYTVREGASFTGNIVKAASGNTYTLEEGIYNYTVSGDGLYTVRKLFLVTEEDITNNKTIVLETSVKARTGFQENGNISLYNDELAEVLFTTNDLVDLDGNPFAGYDFVPAFKEGKAEHQITTHGELLTFIKALDKATPNMYVYQIGFSPGYGYSWPVVIFTNEEIPARASFEEAAAIIAASEKTNVWHQAMIHPNESASGEGAIVMMQELAGAYGEKVLDTINMVVIPRINPDGAYKYQRANVKQGIDMNRDHMYTQAKEITMLHYAENLIMPEVVFDSHEFTANASANSQGIITNTEDIQVTPASSQNIEPAIRAEAQAVVATLFDDLKETGIRIDHYGTTTNNPIGRAYYGLQNAISVLIETRGIGNGATVLERRTFAQVMAVKSMTDSVWAKADEIKEMVAEARATVIAKGATYDEEDTVILSQTANRDREPDLVSQVMSYDYYGNEKGIVEFGIYHYDTVLRERTRPTAYVIPADYENISEVLRIAKNQAFDYIFVEEGSTIVDLQQYGKVSNTEAYLLDAADVTFEGGAYVFPMDQVQGNVLAMTMEPDVNDSNNYNGTLVQSGVIKADEQKFFPIYRFTQDNPRESIYNQGETGPTTVTFVPYDGVDIKDLTVEVYKGSFYSDPQTWQFTPGGDRVNANEDGTYTLDEGLYTYKVWGDGYYTMHKLFNITYYDTVIGNKTITLETSKAAGNGYEADPRLNNETLIRYTDEVLENFYSTSTLLNFPEEGLGIPTSNPNKPENQFTTQAEMMDFITTLNQDGDNMYVFTIGQTPAYNFTWPVVLFTTLDLSAEERNNDFAGAAAKLVADKANGKPIYQHQAQVHSNEASAGDGALFMIKELVGDYGNAILEEINVSVIPRINPDGAYHYTRVNAYDKIDMNRDYLYVKSTEIKYVQKVFNALMPEVVMDGHEFMGYYVEDNKGTIYTSEDIEITGAGSLNMDASVVDFTRNGFVANSFEDLTAEGLRIYHYGSTVNSAISRAYNGMLNTYSILVETAGGCGLNGGRYYHERIAYAQAMASKSFINTILENKEFVLTSIAEARQAVVERGKTYDEENLFILRHAYSRTPESSITSPKPTIYSDGTIDNSVTDTFYYHDSIYTDSQYGPRVRPLPTAYVIPKDAEGAADAVAKLKVHGVEVFELEAGRALPLQQYYYVGLGDSNHIIADFTEEKEVQFAEGAYFIPMDQVTANIIAACLEPDVGDTHGYNGTFVQSGVFSADSEGYYPIYRFCYDEPRLQIYD